MTKKNFFRFTFLLFLIILVALWGNYWTMQSVTTWYVTLPKPAWTPPDSVFGPVWTLLYILMTGSAYLVAKETGLASRAMVFYYLQLVFNGLWSTIFFGFQSPALACVDIIVLLFCILGSIYSFSLHSKVAAYLMIPYLIWVIYAATLNFAILKALL